MGKRSRTKGARGEREVVALLAPVYPGAKRGLTQTRSGDDCADVEGTPFFVEVKIGQRPNIMGAMRQATEACDDRPPVVFTRRDGEQWLVTMRAEDWLAQNATSGLNG